VAGRFSYEDLPRKKTMPIKTLKKSQIVTTKVIISVLLVVNTNENEI